MSIDFYDKIEEIRKAESISQAGLCKLIDIKLDTYEKAKKRKSDIKGQVLKKICNEYPEYIMWLMTDIVQPENGQISPEIKLKTQELKKA